ncbi:MAG: class I SAM-dependent methyltransferase [Candidatus Hodarchaeota archaeon]
MTLLHVKCQRCGSQLKEATVNLRYGLSLDFSKCNSCGYLQELNVDEVKEKLTNKVGRRVGWLQEHLDRFIFTLKLIPFSSRKLVVLDVGSQPGDMTRMVKQLFGYKTYGLDYRNAFSSPLAFRYYLDIMKQNGIFIKECNVDTNPFPFMDEVFDLLLFTEVIEHLRNPLRTLSEIHRVLKPNGNLILSTPNFMRASNRIRALLRLSRRFHGVKEYTLEELKKLLSDANFLVKQVIFSDWCDRKWAKKVLNEFPRTPTHFTKVSNLVAIWTIVRYGLVLKIRPSLSSFIFIIAMKNQ